MKSTREVVLQTLLEQNRCTIWDLARAVGINPISVRHHIAKLEAEGTVSSEEERHGVGRPRRIYFLTEKGLEIFPSHYIHIANRLLQQIKSSFPEKGTKSFFDEIGKTIVSERIDQQQLKKMSMDERFALLKKIMAEEGVTIEWENIGKHYRIHVNQCPFYHVGQSHNEICAIDNSIISEILLIEADFIESILKGNDQCLYVIPKHLSGESTA